MTEIEEVEVKSKPKLQAKAALKKPKFFDKAALKKSLKSSLRAPKVRGNTLFRKGDFKNAIVVYDEGIRDGMGKLRELQLRPQR